jgi:hypothetical protein
MIFTLKLAARVLEILAAILLVTVLAGPGAGASTVQCEHGPLGRYCGTLASNNGDSTDSAHAGAVVDNPVIGWHNNPGDAGSDFAILLSPYNGAAIEIIYTPAGLYTGLCLSDPGGGYPQDPVYPDGIVLRWCNGSKWQAWTYGSSLAGPGSPGSVLTNTATGLVLTDEGFDHQLQDAAPLASGANSTQLWTEQPT